MLYFVCLFCFLFAVETHPPLSLFFVEDFVWKDTDFYESVFKDEWDALSTTKKEAAFNDFLTRELLCYLATKKGFQHTPKVNLQLKQRWRALLINNTYEHMVARPFFSKKTIQLNLKNLIYKARAYHLLVGYQGSAQNTGETLSQEAALRLIDSLSVEINREISLGFLTEEVFSRYSQEYSIDPSVEKNLGLLGWVPWGQTVMSFQAPLFELKPKTVSSPVLTEYGYHLILKTDVAFSNFYYYNKKNYLDLVYKIAQNSVNFDSLRLVAEEFDSLLIKRSGLVLNNSFVDTLFSFLKNKQKTKPLAGNKNTLISWLDSFSFPGVLFVKRGRGFGTSWLVERLKKAPSSRINSIKKGGDLRALLRSFVLQDEVVFLSQENQIDTTSSFLRDWEKNYKEVLYGDYLAFLLNSLPEIDSSVVLLEYERGLYNQQYLRPERVVFSEIRVFTDSARVVLRELKDKGVPFDSLLVVFSGGVREPITRGAKSPLAKTLFSLALGEVSSIIKNSDGSFSLARADAFVAAVPFELSRVYTQIERTLLVQQQDSIKINLLKNLLGSIKTTINYNMVGLK